MVNRAIILALFCLLLCGAHCYTKKEIITAYATKHLHTKIWYSLHSGQVWAIGGDGKLYTATPANRYGDDPTFEGIFEDNEVELKLLCGGGHVANYKITCADGKYK